MNTRRDLKFSNWEEVLGELRLLSAGSQPLGKWDFVQTARHLDDWLRFPMDGFPPSPWPVAAVMWCLRKTIGPGMLRKMIREQHMNNGAPTLPQTVYERTGDPTHDRHVAIQLEQTIARFRDFPGPMQVSPIFGPMDKATAQELQLIHFAHHLSLLCPQTAASQCESPPN